MAMEARMPIESGMAVEAAVAVEAAIAMEAAAAMEPTAAVPHGMSDRGPPEHEREHQSQRRPIRFHAFWTLTPVS
jgi:hypothetical protein